MGKAKKYFTIPRPEYEQNVLHEKRELSDEEIDKFVNKVKKKLKNNNYSLGRKTRDYHAPLPEQVIPDKSSDSLDELVKKTGSSRSSRGYSSSKSRTPLPPINPSKTPPSNPNPWAYAIGEVLQGLKEYVIKDPACPVNKFSRKVVATFGGEPDSMFETVLQELGSIGIYYVLDASTIGKIIKKFF